MLKQIMKGTVAPVIIIAAWLCIAYALGSTMFLNADFPMKFWIIGGLPFGWRYSVHFIPLRGNFALIVGLVVLDIMLAGIIGSVMIAIMIIKAIANLMSALLFHPRAIAA